MSLMLVAVSLQDLKSCAADALIVDPLVQGQADWAKSRTLGPTDAYPLSVKRRNYDPPLCPPLISIRIVSESSISNRINKVYDPR
jgi:hypothetical protein